MQLHSGIGFLFSISGEMMKWVGAKFREGLSRDVFLPPKFYNVDFGKFWHQI